MEGFPDGLQRGLYRLLLLIHTATLRPDQQLVTYQPRRPEGHSWQIDQHVIRQGVALRSGVFGSGPVAFRQARRRAW
jgi:hypothetical protein